MGESRLILLLDSERAFAEQAARFARALQAAGVRPLVLGLRGALGTGKTTWVRAMLRALGYGGRVPSPTYTLLEHYALDGLTVVHLDLYRLRGDEELENLGLRDWLAEPAAWIVVEWPERAPRLAQRCDLELELAETTPGARRVVIEARTRLGIEALSSLRQEGFNNEA